jgi:hypothetical protein
VRESAPDGAIERTGAEGKAVAHVHLTDVAIIDSALGGNV